MAFTVLPPAGSTDSISYAASGRTAVTDRNPYLITPLQLSRDGDVVARQIPAAGFVLVVVPAHLAAGAPAIKVLVTRSAGITWDTMYQLFWRPVLGYTQFTVSDAPPHLELVAYLLFVAVAVAVVAVAVAVARRPDRVPGMLAVTPALALSLAWLFVTAFQRPWYDAMAVSLLALYSASRLDWVVLLRLLCPTCSRWLETRFPQPGAVENFSANGPGCTL